MIDKKELNRLRKIATEATKGAWGPWVANYPFYVDVVKPSPSLSKHDNERPTYWRIEDAVFVLEFCPEKILGLLEELEDLKVELEIKENR